MPYRVQLVDGRSWRPTMEVKPVSGSWARARNEGRGGQMVIQAFDTDHFHNVQRLPVWPFQQWVAVEWAPPGSIDFKIVYAGVITSDVYSWKSKQLTISHSDVWTWFMRRHVLSNRQGSLASSKVVWTNLSPGTIAKRAIQLGMDGDGSVLEYGMPFIFPADVSGSVDMTVYGYNMERVQDILDDVMDSEDGPDIDFRPRWSSTGTLEFVMEVNANRSVLFDYNLDADQTPVKDFEYSLDGTGLANIVYGIGEGSEKKTLVRKSQGDLSPYVALEAVESFKDINKLDRLQRRTTGARKSRDGAIRSIRMTVDVQGPPSVTELRLGAGIKWKADNDIWLPGGWSPAWELLEYSGSMTGNDINLVFQELEGMDGG